MDRVHKKIRADTGSQLPKHSRRPKPHLRLVDNTQSPHEIQRCRLSRAGYQVRRADSPDQRNKANLLVKSMYSWRGYATEDSATLPLNENHIVLEASTEDSLFGTLTVGLDSDDGLLADALYQNEINALRRMGYRVCEMTKLALDPKHSSKEMFASLIHLAYLYAHKIHQHTDLLIEVNPRHAGFYLRRLGFQQIGEERICPRVDAPAVLLHVTLDYMGEQIDRYGGFQDTNEKSLYPYFLSEAEVPRLDTRE